MTTSATNDECDSSGGGDGDSGYTLFVNREKNRHTLKDDDNDKGKHTTLPAVAKRRRRGTSRKKWLNTLTKQEKTAAEVEKEDDDDDDDDVPTTPPVVAKKKRGAVKNQQQTVVCATAEEMVRVACLNIHNTINIDLMEWSEAVLLCLALPTAHDVLEWLSWSQVKTICADNEWSVKISSAINEYIPRRGGCIGVTLTMLLCRNRREKVKRQYLTADHTDMFHAAATRPPRVDMKMLNRYMPLIQLHAGTKFNKALFYRRPGSRVIKIDDAISAAP